MRVFSLEKRLNRRIAATTLVVLVIGIVWMAPVREERTWVDASSGSIKRQTEWPFGVKTKEIIQHSSLERWIREHGRSHEYNWHTLAITSETVFGRAVVRACGTAPPIYQLRPLLNDFLALANEEEIDQLVQALSSGSEQDQEHAVDLANEKVLTAATVNRKSVEYNEAIDRR